MTKYIDGGSILATGAAVLLIGFGIVIEAIAILFGSVLPDQFEALGVIAIFSGLVVTLALAARMVYLVDIPESTSSERRR